jgi:diguanylate cyclase
MIDMQLPQWRQWGASLKFRLTLACLVLVALSVVGTALLVLEEVRLRTERTVLDMEVNNVERLAGVLGSRVISLQRALRSVVEVLDPDTLKSPPALQALLKSKPVLATLFPTIFIADAAGHALMVRDHDDIRASSLDLSDRAYFQDTMRLRRPVVSQAISSRLSNDPVLVLTMPILDRRGKVLGMMGGTVRLNAPDLLMELTQGHLSDNDPVVTVVVDQSGHILAHPDRQRIMAVATTEPGLGPAVARWMAQGSVIEPMGESTHGEGYFMAQAGVPAADWMVFRAAPDQLLLVGRAEAETRALQLAAAMGVLVGVLMLLLLMVMLRPLELLRRRALGLQHGTLPLDEGWPVLGGEIGQLSAVLQHVLRERRMTEEVTDALIGKLRSVMVAAPIGIAFTRERRFELVSRAFSALLGYPDGSLVGQPGRSIFSSDQEYDRVGQEVARAFAAGEHFECVMVFHRKDGGSFRGRMQARPVELDNPGAGTCWLLEDVTREMTARERLSWAASHDALTGLWNRDAFESQLQSVLDAPPDQRAGVVFFIDLDHFKQINDSAGHEAGDQVLKDFASLLERTVRGGDTVARLGGDEFAVLLPGCPVHTAMDIAQRIRSEALAVGVTHQDRRLTIGTSIGLVSIDADTPDVATVLRIADGACYSAKHAGRNTVRQARNRTVPEMEASPA